MKTKELIEKLQELDPEGEMEVKFPWGYAPHVDSEVIEVDRREEDNYLVLRTI